MNLKSIKFPGLDGEYTIPQTAEDVGATNMKLLWENASTASEFAGQTISLNLSDYDVVVITASNDTSEIIPVGKSGAITTWNGYYISKRTVNVSTSGVQFSAVTKWTEYGTNKQSETVDNSQAKPNRIYGIKGVS